MLIDTLNERIIDMKTVHEMETASADTKKQAMADYNFKQLIPEKISQSIQFDKESAKFLVDLLSKEFDL